MSYNLLNPVHIIVAQSMATSITSAAQETKLQDNLGVQFNWTGAPVGTFGVQVSMDYHQDQEGNITNPGNWTTLPIVPIIIATGSPNTAYIDLNQLSAPYIRVFYTATSGTGTLDAFINGKGV
jgi:hypothetical protein